MFVKLPFLVFWSLNVGGWLLLQLGVAAVASRMPINRFSHDSGLLTFLPFERDGRIYERFLFIRSWKHRLPDGGSWFRQGFSKRKLQARSADYLSRFASETRRGELVHWYMLAPIPLFAIWNNGLSMLIIIAYAIIANIPCILVQRYNRARLMLLAENQVKRSKQMSQQSRVCYANDLSQQPAEPDTDYLSS